MDTSKYEIARDRLGFEHCTDWREPAPIIAAREAAGWELWKDMCEPSARGNNGPRWLLWRRPWVPPVYVPDECVEALARRCEGARCAEGASCARGARLSTPTYEHAFPRAEVVAGACSRFYPHPSLSSETGWRGGPRFEWWRGE